MHVLLMSWHPLTGYIVFKAQMLIEACVTAVLNILGESQRW